MSLLRLLSIAFFKFGKLPRFSCLTEDFALLNWTSMSGGEDMVKSTQLKCRHSSCLGMFLAVTLVWSVCRADVPSEEPTTNSFPAVPEVLGGRTFENTTEQDIYFLQAIHDSYAAHWTELLEANITLNDFVLAPEKMLRFINELGEAMRGRNDIAACTNLTVVTSDPSFYSNTNVSHPEILKAAASALIKIGPAGRKALASAFTVEHYRNDPASLEVLADAIGELRPPEPEFVKALEAVAFEYSTTNGSIYPKCIRLSVNDLINLNGGIPVVRAHMKIEELLNNPGRFEAVVEGIGEAGSRQLAGSLGPLQPQIKAKLSELANSPGGYREDLKALNDQIERVLGKK